MTWLIDDTHTHLGFSVKHMMVSTVRGQFKQYRGTLALDPADFTRSSFEGEIDVASIDTGNGQRDDHLRTSDFFDAANHPNISFKSTKIEAKAGGADGEYVVRGDLDDPRRDQTGRARRGVLRHFEKSLGQDGRGPERSRHHQPQGLRRELQCAARNRRRGGRREGEDRGRGRAGGTGCHAGCHCGGRSGWLGLSAPMKRARPWPLEAKRAQARPSVSSRHRAGARCNGCAVANSVSCQALAVRRFGAVVSSGSTSGSCSRSRRQCSRHANGRMCGGNADCISARCSAQARCARLVRRSGNNDRTGRGSSRSSTHR